MIKSLLVFLVALILLGGCAKPEAEAKTEEPVVKPETAQEETETGMSAEDEDAYMASAKELEKKLKAKEETNRKNKEVISIEEKIFLSQMTDVYMNTEDYIGRTISIEGFMRGENWGDGIVGMVMRNSPGCCGDDGETGLSYIWDGDVPKENDWLKVTGVLSSRFDQGDLYLVIEADDVEVLEERGLEFVSQ